MSWIQRYRLRNAIRSSLWIAPLLSMGSALIIHRFLWQGNGWTGWTLLGFQPNGARGMLGAISNSMLTFIVFVFSVLLLVVQIASTNLSPRVIAFAFKSYPAKTALAMFLFTYIYAIGVLGRIEDTVPQFEVLLTIFFCLVSLAAFLYLIDYTGKGLRPVSVAARVANDGYRVVVRMYPRLLMESNAARAEVHAVQAVEQPRVICHVGTSGVFLAFDAEGLIALARRAECVIRVVPQVGEFVAVGAPLFHVYHDGGSTIAERKLHRAVAFGPERTMEQDPLFAFRILVDITSKALSPAINDPTTAVVAIDQIHHLLHQVGLRDLGSGEMLDEEGHLRLIFQTPDWEDFVHLAVAEIRLFGSGSIQVARRLHAVFEHLSEVLPPQRILALRTESTLLHRAVERAFPDPEDRIQAEISDSLGLGSTRARRHWQRG
jgi:uncharacterized membrane protein